MKMSRAIISIVRKMHLRFSIAKNSKTADTAKAFFSQKTVWIIVIGDVIALGCTKFTQ